jgi:hypothetical protein
MVKNTKSGLLASYPHLWKWVTDFGTVEIGACGSDMFVYQRSG